MQGNKGISSMSIPSMITRTHPCSSSQLNYRSSVSYIISRCSVPTVSRQAKWQCFSTLEKMKLTAPKHGHDTLLLHRHVAQGFLIQDTLNHCDTKFRKLCLPSSAFCAYRLPSQLLLINTGGAPLAAREANFCHKKLSVLNHSFRTKTTSPALVLLQIGTKSKSSPCCSLLCQYI